MTASSMTAFRNDAARVIHERQPDMDQRHVEALVDDLVAVTWPEVQLAAIKAREEVVAIMLAHLDGMERAGLLGFIDARRLRAYVSGLDQAPQMRADQIEPASDDLLDRIEQAAASSDTPVPPREVWRAVLARLHRERARADRAVADLAGEG